MSHAYTPAWHMTLRALMLIIASASVSAHAHVTWNRVNSVDIDTVALYQFDNTTTGVAPPESPIAGDMGLTPISARVNLSPVDDTPGEIFAPRALALPLTQTLRTTATAQQLDGDLTIECWFKWTPQMTSSSLEIGLQSGARLVIARDESFPQNDGLGIAGTHGSFVAATGFSNWSAVGDEEASLNEWRHLALTIHSAGIHHDTAAAHDVYSTGTVGRLYLNGHQLGIAPADIVDLSGLKVHDASRLTVIMRGGGIVIDELAIWRRDWSENGLNGNPFSNGRGGESSVIEWPRYYE